MLQAFRCVGCGFVQEIDADDGRIRLNRPTDPPVSCGRCARTRTWVLAGSTTEFYEFWRRTDVCRVGEHVAVETREYSVRAGEITFFIRACPEHVEALRAGWGGYRFIG